VAVGLVVIVPAWAETPGSTLRPSANGRHVEWSDGTPVFLLSDTAWLMPGRYSDSEVTNHATTRAAQGFTAIQMTAAFPELQRGASAPLQDINKIFTSGDMGRPIDSYFDRVEWVVNQVTSRGLVVILNPFWKKTMDAYLGRQGEAKNRSYARYLASRFVNNPRVAYFIGGDAAPLAVRPELNAQGMGVLDAYAAAGKPKPLVAYHSKGGESSRQAFTTGAPWLNLNWTYDYAPKPEAQGGTPYAENWEDWAKSPAMPMMFGEGFYDRNNGGLASSRWMDRHGLRRQAWWSTFSGGLGGYAYGAEPIWLHRYNGLTPTTALTWESGKDAAKMKSFLTSTQWTRLQPDINHKFLTGGYGRFGYLDHAIASVADDKSFAVVYTPIAHSLNLRMPATGRTYTLRWFDPSSGTYRSGSTTAASGAAITMTTPGNNSSGAPDWAIHVSSGATPTTPTPTTPTPTTSQPQPTGTYELVNRRSGKVLGVTGASTTDGATVTQQTSTGAASQRWQRVDVGGGYFKLINAGSGKAMDVFGKGLTDGVAVVQWTDNGGANQQWQAVTTDGGYAKLINRRSGKAVDVFAGAVTDGTPIVQWTDNNGTNQQWQLAAR
jgi:hypothetical protein